MAIFKCIKCGSNDVRQKISMLIDPNASEEDFGYALADNRWEWDDFSYCIDCQDGTSLIEENEQET